MSPRLKQEGAGLAIRTAAADDEHRLTLARIAFYRTQIAASWLDLPADLDGWVTENTGGIIRNPRNCVFLAGAEDALAGYAYGVTKIVPGVAKPMIASIEEIYVSPDHRGLGLARRLFEMALAAFNARGADRIQLRVLAENASGRAFWSGIGFQENVVIYEFEQARRT